MTDSMPAKAFRAPAGATAPAAEASSDVLDSGRQDLLDRYRAVRRRSLAIAAPLSAEDQAAQSMPDASPTKWHLAHTSWFFETMVLAESGDYARFDPAYGYLFNSYYEALGPRQPRPQRGLLTRPSVAEVAAYRAHVDEALEQKLSSGELSPSLLARVVLGLAHEEQHQELILTDVLHLLAQNPLRPAYDPCFPAAAVGGASELRFVPLPGGIASIGAATGDGLETPFVFDNEGPPHRTWLEPFALADRLVSNREWLGFMQEGGYDRAELWLSDGWAHVQQHGWRAPLYWEDGWRAFGPSGLSSLDPHAAVRHVSYYEADAFARWRGARLPTEAEWEVAAVSCPDAFDDLFGMAWQWTASPYVAYPGFRPGAGALGEYNGKFMINQLVLRGSSWATAPGHSRPSYRNFFPPDARWQVAGVRLAAGAGEFA